MTTRETMRRAAVLATLAVLAAGTLSDTSAGAAPSGPTALTATAANTTVKLAWKTGAEAKDVVERSLSPTAGFSAISGERRVKKAGAATSSKDGGRTPGATYYYRIRGITPGGDVVSNVAGVTIAGGATTTTTTSTTTSTTTTTVPAGPGVGQAQWWHGYGGVSSDSGVRAAVDSDGNVAVGTLIGGRVNLGGAMIGVDGYMSSALASYTPAGAHRWSRAVVGSLNGIGNGSNGDVVAVSNFSGAQTVDGETTAPSSQNLYAARYSSSGALLAEWVAGSSTGWALPQAVAAGTNGSVVVTGYTSGAFDFKCGMLASAGSQRSAFVVKYDATGRCTWAKRFVPTVDGGGLGVAIDSTGNVVISGSFKGSIDLGRGSLQSANGSEDLFVAQYSPSGAAQWTKRFGDVADDRGTAVTTDANGTVVLTGYFGGTVDFGGGSLTNPTVTTPYGSLLERDIFLAAFTPTGVHRWSKNFTPGAAADGNGAMALAVAADQSGNVLLTGSITNAVNFGGGPLAGAHTGDLFVAKFSAAGGHVWSRRSGGSFDDRGYGVGVGPTGNVMVTGAFYTSVGSLTSHGVNDIFVVSYTP